MVGAGGTGTHRGTRGWPGGGTTAVTPRPPQVSDATGRMDLTEVSRSSPFSQSLLCPDDCFVLDTGAGGKVYVWKGAWGQGRGQGWGPPTEADVPVRRAQSQRAGAPGGSQRGRADHRPHGLLAPHAGGHRRAGGGTVTSPRPPSPPCPRPAGGDPAAGPRDAPLQAVLRQLEVRGGGTVGPGRPPATLGPFPRPGHPHAPPSPPPCHCCHPIPTPLPPPCPIPCRPQAHFVPVLTPVPCRPPPHPLCCCAPATSTLPHAHSPSPCHPPPAPVPWQIKARC